MNGDILRMGTALLYSTAVVAFGRRLQRPASIAAYSTALAILVNIPLLSDATAQQVDTLLGLVGAGRLVLCLSSVTLLLGAFLTVMLATHQWAGRHWLAIGGTGVFTGLFVLCWLRLQTLDRPDIVAVLYGLRAGDPPTIFWMNVFSGLCIVYMAAWSLREFLRFLRGARNTYERGLAGLLVTLYTCTGCIGLLIVVEAVGHQRGWNMAVFFEVQTALKIFVPAMVVCLLIGQCWLWPLWRHRRHLLVRYVMPELVRLRHDLLNLSAWEAEQHLDIHHEAYANRTIVEAVYTRCRAAGLSAARCAIARMAASLITFQRDNVLQDPSYGLETSWAALREDAAAEINQGMAATAWERALRDAYISQHVYCLMFLVLDCRSFREILLIDERPRLQAWHQQVAEIIATVMQAHGHPTPRFTTMAQRRALGSRFPRLCAFLAWRRRSTLDAAEPPGGHAPTT